VCAFIHECMCVCVCVCVCVCACVCVDAPLQEIREYYGEELFVCVCARCIARMCVCARCVIYGKYIVCVRTST
jgi:hypothetical protein